MVRTHQVRIRLALIAAVTLLAVTSPLMAEIEAPGWGGPDIAGALQLARESGEPILVLVRQPRCPLCDDVERLLMEDPEVVALTRPFIRLRIDVRNAAGQDAARRLKLRLVPAVLFMGPGGMEATRRERDIDRPWLMEQLRVVAFRHAKKRTRPSPTVQAILASLARLEQWGDLDGAERLRARLGPTDPVAAGASVQPPAAPSRPIATRQDIDDLLRSEDEPARLRTMAFELALWLEHRGDPEMALHSLKTTLETIGSDPITRARAGFLAARQGVALESVREELMAARLLDPASLPELLALARVAEATGRLFQAYHVAEAAAVYAPDDAFIALELYRLQLLIHLNSRRSEERDPA